MKERIGISVETVLDVIIADEQLFLHVLSIIIPKITRNHSIFSTNRTYLIDIVDSFIEKTFKDVEIVEIIKSFVPLLRVDSCEKYKIDDENEQEGNDFEIMPNYSVSEPSFEMSPNRKANAQQQNLDNSMNRGKEAVENHDGDSPSLSIEVNDGIEFSALSGSHDSSDSTIKTTIHPDIHAVSQLNLCSSSQLTSTNTENMEKEEFTTGDHNKLHNDISEDYADVAHPQNSESTPSGKRRVAFKDDIISRVHYRDKTDPSEKHHMYYSHEEEEKFTRDQNREYLKANSLGLSWMEWVNKFSDGNENDIVFNDSDQYDDDEYYDEDQF